MLKKIRYRLKIIKAFFPYAKGVRRFFVLNLLLSVISMLLGFITPQFYKMFIDQVIIAKKFSSITIIVIGYLGVFFIGSAIGYLKNYSSYTFVNTVLYRIKHKIFKALLSIPFARYEKMSIGDMKMRLEDDTEQVGSFAGAQTIDYLISYITLIVSAVWLFVIDWRLAIFSIIAIPLTFWMDNIISKCECVLNNQNRDNDQKMTAWLHASIQGWREIKALNLEKRQKIQFIRFLHNHALYFAKWINFWVARVLVIPKIKDEVFMRFGLYFFGGFLIINGHMKISDLLVFAMYYSMLSGAINSVSSYDAELQSNMSYTNRLLEELDSNSVIINDGLVPDDTNIIELKAVSFAYPITNNEIIHNIDLQIGKGERVAITGKSGCGKTTLLKLITGMVEPTTGVVSFSGISLRNIDLETMHSRIGFVMQENILFNETIRENLLYSKETASESELRDACEKAHILSFVDSLPEGFDAVIGERGIKLSGGQRQRLVLARFFLQNVAIFIFDEATSALDQYSENIVYDAMRSIAEDKTIILVAHRESSIRLCDKKITLSDGGILVAEKT